MWTLWCSTSPCQTPQSVATIALSQAFPERWWVTDEMVRDGDWKGIARHITEVAGSLMCNMCDSGVSMSKSRSPIRRKQKWNHNKVNVVELTQVEK